ncbi:prosaposin-like isoform X1 [Salvelinus namaycush]|uniref:Pulmonary surfactant-associated protein B n=1 Tax=Salvelinus namaycush TaxID=8040 RepID=A0A8U0TWW8_SALNM|nr:prosaposin-like isoform X1 [Salvelinus namaycush]
MRHDINAVNAPTLHCSAQNQAPFEFIQSLEQEERQPDINSTVMLYLALFFISAAVATPLLGTEQCARGPPYWCQNVKTASICGAVVHCQQNVWNQPQMKSVPCDLCKEVLLVVDQLLKDNATEGEILGYLEKACTLIPDKDLSAQCKEMVDSYYPILMGIITGGLEDPQVACGAMGLCASQQAALARLAKLTSNQIPQLTSNEIPQVDLAQRVAPFLLNVPGLLYPQAQDNTKQEPAAAQETGDVCEDCVKFITDTQEEAKRNSTFVNALIEQIQDQCDMLGPGISDLCKQYVSQYAPLIVQQLMSMEQQPKDICAVAGFCSADVKSSVPMMKLVAAKTIPAVKLFPATKMEAVKPAKNMVRARDSPQCALCEFMMKEMESMLEDEKMEQDVVRAVEKVCSVLPSSLSVQCKDLIEAYGQAIIELLVQEADPKTICTVLGLCKDASRAFIPVLDQAKVEAGGFCEVCKVAVQYIDGILEQNATEAQIEDAVRKVCSFVPEAVRSECDQLVEQYEPMLVQLLLQMLDPDFVCMKLGVCPEAVQMLLGMEQCTWGPAFWCKDMDSAKRCNAVAHCRRHVWE